MKNNERGQSTIEFIITFVFGLSIILMIFNSALNYASGYLVHYATFMASRTMLTSDTNLGAVSSPEASYGDVDMSARGAFNKFQLGLFNLKDLNFKVNLPQPNSDGSYYLMVGAVTTFKQKMDITKWVTGGAMLDLTSESFLGVEPTRATCANRVCAAITGDGSANCQESTHDVTLYDDGC